MPATLTNAWPAPPVASPWGRMVLRVVPPTRGAVRLPQAKPTRERREPRRQSQPDHITGLCARLESMFECEFREGDDSSPALGQFLYAPGSLSRWLHRVQAGDVECWLRLGHKGAGPYSNVISTRSGSLSFWLTADCLWCRVHGDTAEGRAAIAVLRASRDRCLSVGVERVRTVRMRGAALPTHIITEGDIYEVSVVPLGAHPDARLLL
jgi:hypothetical protein